MEDRQKRKFNRITIFGFKSLGTEHDDKDYQVDRESSCKPN